MIIIFEGVDCAGKTTAVAKTAARIKSQIPGAQINMMHKSKPTASNIVDEYITDEIRNHRPRRDEVLLCDRWHIGEMIYGPLYRGESRLDQQNLTFIENMLCAHGAFLVHLDHDVKTIEKRYLERGETFLQREHIPHVLRVYRELVQVSRIPSVTLCDPTDEHILGIITSAALQEVSAQTRMRMVL